VVFHISRNFKSYFGCADSKHKTELKKHTIPNLRTLLQRSRLIVNYSGVSLATLVLFKAMKCEVDKSIFHIDTALSYMDVSLQNVAF